jgi:hypothetical protein
LDQPLFAELSRQLRKGSRTGAWTYGKDNIGRNLGKSGWAERESQVMQIDSAR